MSPVKMAAVMLAAFALVGCAGSKYEKAASRIPPVPQDKGRIYFYQPQPEMMSSAQQKLRVNEVVVGRNKPGAFFFVDRPAGSYTVTNLYWTGDGVSFMLDAGQTRYVRIVAESLGSTGASGKLMMELVDPPEMAEREMHRLRYWGAASPEQVPGL